MAQDIRSGISIGAANGNKRSATETIRELTEASKQLFEAGKQVTDSLSELSVKLEQASKVGSTLAKSPWLLAGGALLAGAIILSRTRTR